MLAPPSSFGGKRHSLCLIRNHGGIDARDFIEIAFLSTQNIISAMRLAQFPTCGLLIGPKVKVRGAPTVSQSKHMRRKFEPERRHLDESGAIDTVPMSGERYEDLHVNTRQQKRNRAVFIAGSQFNKTEAKNVARVCLCGYRRYLT